MAVESTPSEDITIIKSKLDLSHEDIWKLVEKDNLKFNRKRGLNNKGEFIQKVLRYLRSIDYSQGFECTDFPGRIEGLTTVEPKFEFCQINDAVRESFTYLLHLGRHVVNDYNQANGTTFILIRVDRVTSFVLDDTCTYYYFTLAVAADIVYKYCEQTIQAKVRDKDIDWEVLVCDLKTTASSEAPK